MKDNFSRQADLYARYRPVYPEKLFDFMLEKAPGREIAWDCATGNGQTATVLGRYFKQVWATDISRKQIDHATVADNIIYSVQPAEQTDFADHSVDLVTVSQALHWFNFEKFYKEVKRVGRPGSWLAVWAYSLLKIEPDIDAIIEAYHFGTLKDYWDAERKYVDDHYANIPFPFVEITTPSFFIEYNWKLDDVQGYLYTWSALQKFIAAGNDDPIPGLIARIRPHWKQETKKIVFPLHLKMAGIDSFGF